MFPPRVSYLHNNKWENLLENKTHKKMFYKVKWSEILSMAKVVGFCPSRLLCCFSFKSSFFSYYQKLEKNIYTRRRYIYLFSLKRDILLSEIWLVWSSFFHLLGNFRFFIFHFLFVFIFIIKIATKITSMLYIFIIQELIIIKYKKWWNSIKLWFVNVF